MYTFRTFLVVILAAHVIAAPPTEEPAECKPPKEKEGDLAKCCSIHKEATVKESAAAEECLELVKDAGKKGPLKPEGYECIEDCVMSKLGFLTADKKIDPAKVNAAVKSLYTGDWAAIGAKSVEKCLAKAAANKDKGECFSSSDVFLKCLIRDTYMNCPEKSWINSDLCNAYKEKLDKCPNLMP